MCVSKELIQWRLESIKSPGVVMLTVVCRPKQAPPLSMAYWLPYLSDLAGTKAAVLALYITYDHTRWKTRDPSCSPSDKLVRARPVVGLVMPGEYLVRIFFVPFLPQAIISALSFYTLKLCYLILSYGFFLGGCPLRTKSYACLSYLCA